MSAPESSGALRVGVLGGSNSLLIDGYLAVAMRVLREERAVPVILVRNESLGACSSCMGLIKLGATGIHHEVDLLLVEYAVNDIGTYRGRPELLARCRECFDELLRRCALESPQLRVCTVILTSRSPAQRKHSGPVVAMMRELSAAWGAHVVDIESLFAKTDPSPHAEDHLWQDPVHFSIPEGVEVVGRAVAAGMAEALRGPRVEPRGTSPGDLADVKYLPATELVTEGPVERRPYHNWAVDVTAMRLHPSSATRFRLDGELVAFYYVAELSSTHLSVRIGDGEVVLPTMPLALADQRRWPFLVGHLVPSLQCDLTLRSQGDQEAVIAPVPPLSPALPDNIWLGDPVDHDGLGFALVGILHTGRLVTTT